MKISTSPVRVFARPAVFATLAILLMGTFCLSFSQTTNTRVSGTVKDSSGAVVPGVTVKVIDNATRSERTIVTNEDGYFVITDVRAGTYTVTAERTGFKRSEVQNIQVNVDRPVTVHIDLEAGGLNEKVSVTASDVQALIRSDDAKLSTTIDVKQVQDLPLNGRNPINLAGGMAGVNTNTNVRGSSINGLRGSFSNITWDGIGINDNLVRTDALFGVNTPSVASVSEFSLTTQNGGPDEGLGIAQVKLTTPRGGQEYHGQGYDFYRNDKFDANTFFNNAQGLARPKLLQHQYGFNVGGPFPLPRFGEGGDSMMRKRKQFFYFFYEKINTTVDFTPLRTVLSASARTGSFTYLATCTTNCPAGVTNGSRVTVNLLALSGGRTIDPRMQEFINLTPASNNNDAGDGRNTQGFRFNTPNGSTSRNWGFRIDADINSTNRVEAIYSRFTSLLPNDVQLNNIGEQFPGLPGGGQQSVRPRVSFGWHWNPTSSITNEFRAGWAKNTPEFFNREKFLLGYRLSLPLITNPIQTFLQQGRIPNNYDFIDNLSWVKGNHLMRFGGQYRAVRILSFNDAGIVPQFTIGFNTTNNTNPLVNNSTNFPGGISSTEFTNATSVLALLTGALSQATQTFQVASKTSGFTRGVGSRRHLNYDTLAFYGGDTWRIRPNLSLNFGLRWEYISPVVEQDGLALLPVDTSLAALNDPNARLDFAGAGSNRPIVARDMDNFAPSFSFAWDPFKNGKTSLRGGFGMSYAIDNNITVINNAIGNNAGLASTFTNVDLKGTVSGPVTACPNCGGIFTVPTPAFQVPRTLQDQFSLSQTPTIFTTEFNLKTPYATQWNIGIEREIFRDTAISVGYVGNRGTQLTRGLDTNQVTVFQNGFFNDFLRGQGNLAAVRAERDRINADPTLTAAQRTAMLAARPVSAAQNTLVPGSQQLLVFPLLGHPTAANRGGNLANATIVNLFDTGQVGELVSTYVSSRCTYLVQQPFQNCSSLFGAGPNASQLGAGFFLPANPNAFVTDYVGSSGWSNYHGLQAEIRKRLSNGWYYQVNYTWSKAFTNADQAQTEFSPYLDLTHGDVLEKKRIVQDVTHVFKGNAVYELPFGSGKRFFNGGSFSNKLLGGWQVSGLVQVRTGRPISFIAGAGTAGSPFRGTVNRSARSGNNTAVNVTNLSIQQIQSMTGLFYSPTTTLPLLFDPQLIGSDNRANPAFLANPTAGNFGNLSLTPVSGPGYWNADMALIKRTRFTESVNLELRLEAFNVFNHTNFSVNENNDINSTSFGKITTTFDPRILQLAFKFNF